MSICNDVSDFDVNSLFSKNNNTTKNEIKEHTKKEETPTNNEVKLFKEKLIDFMSSENLSKLTPLIIISYHKTENKRAHSVISIDGEDIPVKPQFNGPIYNKKSMEVNYKNIIKTMNRDDFVYLEIYSLSKVLGETDRDVLNGKLKEEDIKIGDSNYGNAVFKHLSLLK